MAKGKDGTAEKTVAASALRLSFKTDRPLFPYREPDSVKSAEALGARDRLLRIYFLADARYKGELTKETPARWRVTASDGAQDLTAAEARREWLRKRFKLKPAATTDVKSVLDAEPPAPKETGRRKRLAELAAPSTTR